MEVGERAFAFLDQVRNMGDVDEATELFAASVEPYGFKYVAISGFFDYDRLSSQDLLLDSWPSEWRERYFEGRYHLKDPVALSFFRFTRPYTWEEAVATTPKSDMHFEVMNEASEFDLKSGYVIPMLGHQGYKAMVTCAGQRVDHDPRTLAAIHIMAVYSHDRIRKLSYGSPDRRLPAPPSLSARELECLRWAAQGKSNWEISQILSISENTVATYMKRSMKKFDVGSRTQAVVLASQLLH